MKNKIVLIVRNIRSIINNFVSQLQASLIIKKLSNLFKIGDFKLLYYILGLLAILGLIFSFTLPSSLSFTSLIQNISTEIIGIIITLAIVERFITNNQNVTKLKLSQGAFNKSKYLIQDLSNILIECIIASNERPRNKINSYSDLFNRKMINGFDYIDIGHDWGFQSNCTFAESISFYVKSFKKGATEIIDIYSGFLPTDYLEILDVVNDHIYLRYLEGFGELIRNDKGDSNERTILVPNDGQIERMDFFSKFILLIDIHNKYSHHHIKLDFERFSSKSDKYVFPHWGQLIIDLDQPFEPINWIR